MEKIIIYDWKPGFTKGGLNRLLRRRAGHSLSSAIQAVDGLLQRRPIEIILESGCRAEEFLQEITELGAVGKVEGFREKEVGETSAKEHAITLPVSEEVMSHLTRLAPVVGFANGQALIQHYIMQGLKVDMEKFMSIHPLIESLKRHGVDEAVITMAMEEISRPQQ